MISRKQHVVNNLLLSVLHGVPENVSREETIVLLHGWGSEAKVWRGLIEFLCEKGFAVIAPDLPGFGESEFPRQDYEVSDYADIVQELLRQEGVGNYVLVGHSFGGRIGIKTAALHFSGLKKMILTGAAGIPPQSAKKSFLTAGSSLIKKILPASIIKKMRKKIYFAIGSSEYLAIPQLEGTFRKVVNEDLRPHLKEINIPALLVWGSKDDATPIQDGEIMKSEIKNSKLVVFDGASHYAFLDNPSRFHEEVLQFIQS